MFRLKLCDQIEVYDVITYRLQRFLNVPNASGLVDVTSCEHHRCVYFSDFMQQCVHRLDSEREITQWPVRDEPQSLSVNAAHNVLVTCRRVRKIKEFSSHGDWLRTLSLPDDVVNPWHAIQLTSGQLVVCHGNTFDDVHRVCSMSADCGEIVCSHGGRSGSDTGQHNVPRQMAVDGNDFMFVADVINRRVTLLSPTLNYVRHAVESDQLKGSPRRLCLDVQRRFLYVADNEWNNVAYRAGRIVVFRV